MQKFISHHHNDVIDLVTCQLEHQITVRNNNVKDYARTNGHYGR
jgi:hypothetical protein